MPLVIKQVALEQSQLASVTRQTAVIMDDGGREGWFLSC